MQHKMIRTMFLAILLLVLVTFIYSCSNGSRLSLSSFVSISTEGISGKGTAEINVDWEGIKHEVLGRTPTGGSALELYQEKAADLESSLSFILDKTSGLSNGDIVKVSIVCTETASIAYNVKMYESIEVTLNDFLVQTEIDLFEELEVVFTGCSPNVALEIKNTSQNDFLKAVTFTASKYNGITLGEEVLITAAYSQELADSFGYIPVAKTKTYTVQNVAYYPYSYSDLPTDLVRSLMSLSSKQVNERWKDYCTVILAVMGENVDRQQYIDSKVADIQIQDPALTEIIVLSRRDTLGSWFGSYNYLFFVYKTVVNDSVSCENVEVYQCVVFSDILVHEDGSVDYFQLNTEKPTYEITTMDEIITILQKEYPLYDYEVVWK